MSSPSPAPWVVEPNVKAGGINHLAVTCRQNGFDWMVCSVTPMHQVRDIDEANATLIAEAPALLAALNALFQTACKHRWKVNSDEPDTIELARKAIQLAEGGAR